MAFPARYPGTCKAPECVIWPVTKRINVGESIRWARRGDKAVYHEACYNAMKGIPMQTEEVQEYNQVLEEVKTMAPELALVPSTPILSNTGLAALLASEIAPYLESKLNVKLDESAVNRIIDSRIGSVIEDAAVAASKTVQDAIAALPKPTRVEVINRSTEEIRDLGIVHKSFPTLLQIAQARTSDGHYLNIELIGPSGTGKTHAARQVSEALDLPFYYCGAVMEPWSLLGFKNATGEYQSTMFRQAYEQGGVFLLDEKDGSDANAILPFNGATANGHCPFPDGMVTRHKNCLIMAASNTWGLGGTNDYVGRLKQDAASLDRFIQVPWETDESLEMETAGNREWTLYVQKVRANVKTKGIKVIVSPRASYYGSALLARGLDRKVVEQVVLQKAMNAEQWQSVK